MINIGSLEERRARLDDIRLVTAALYEAKVKDDEIIRVLMKVCETDKQEAINAIQNEKFMFSPCRELYQYLLLDKGFNENDADKFIHTKAKRALAKNTDLSKLSPSKLYDALNK
ncbi:MAG: hypothetical protein JXQ26_01105 [Tissierellales bacterium]|nr:hypothetical protein [Tissierellales bacterium]